MKNFLILSLLLFSTFILADTLPDTLPNDVVIRYYKPLGHAGRGFSMELTTNNCKYQDKSIHRENEFSFKITPEELNTIYQSFKKNKLHKIENDDDFLHDYDGISLSVSWAGKSIDISQSGRRIKSSWQKEWNNIITPLEKVREREIANAEKEMQLTFDKSLIGSFIHIQIDSSNTLIRKYIDATALKENPIRIKSLPGSISMYCILYKGYDPKKKAEIYSDFDPERSSLWDQKHNEYLNSLKQESFTLTLDFTTKKSFQLIRKADKLQIQ